MIDAIPYRNFITFAVCQVLSLSCEILEDCTLIA